MRRICFVAEIIDCRSDSRVDGRIRVSGKGLRLAGVPLELDGDFEIDDVLTPAPADCASPVLLIRNVPGTWFAAGIPVVEKHRS